MSYFKTVETNPADSFALDAFQRQRVSEQYSLCDLQQIWDGLPLLIDGVVNGTGTKTYNAGEASTTLATSASGDYAIAQTKQRYKYYAGKSSAIAITFYNFHIQTNVIKRVGYFNSSSTAPYTGGFDGIYLESNGVTGVVSLNIDRGGTSIDSAAQSAWNKDVFDGSNSSSNPSGLSIDYIKNQILFVDLQFLGVGRVRVGFNINGKLYIAHEFNHANLIQKVYISSPNHSIRWEIRQSGAGSGTFTYVCASVSSEGAINNTAGLIFTENTSEVPTATNTIGTTYALLGLRLRSTALDAVVDILNLSLLANTNDWFFWELLINPTIAGTFGFSNYPNSSIQTAIGSSTNTISNPGIRIASKMTQNTDSSLVNIDSPLRLGSTINGTSDIIILSITPISSNINSFASITWREM
jgi:hypothetical protein